MQNHMLRLRNKTLCISCLTLVLLSVSLPSYAQNASGCQEDLCVVNMEQVFKNSKAGQALKRAIDSRARDARNKFDKLNSQFIQSEKLFKKQLPTLSRQAIQAKQLELVKSRNSIAKSANELKKSVEKENAADSSNLYAKISAATDAVSKAKKIPFVLIANSQQVIYTNPRLDLTSEVINTLNSGKIK